jgi:AcrR family transcriptional regulator
MNESTDSRRTYDLRHRAATAEKTRARILAAARDLMGKRGVDHVTIAEIGRAAGVATSTIYATLKSKEGILRALMEQSLFGPAFQNAQGLLDGVTDPVRQIALTAHVARAIYEGERHDLGMIRHISGFSKALREVEEEFEAQRFARQQARITALFAAGRARPGLTLDEARRLMWMLTGRGVYAALVTDGGWTPDRYQGWLEGALLSELVAPDGSAEAV